RFQEGQSAARQGDRSCAESHRRRWQVRKDHERLGARRDRRRSGNLRVGAGRFAKAMEDKGGDPMAGLAPGPPVPLRRPGRWVAFALVLFLAACFGHLVVTNPNFQWPVVGKYLFDRNILRGVLLTIELTVSAMCIGIALG